MKNRILYIGDTALDRQASYLAGIMAHYGIAYDYISSDHSFDDKLLENNYRLLIISDYPSSNFNEMQLQEIALQVKNGMGLLMVGGWESFVGQSGEYNNTVFSEILPVKMNNSDDRHNTFNPCIITKAKNHIIIDTLPLSKNLPTIAGFNELEAKGEAEILLSVHEYSVNMPNKEISWNLINEYPLLVVGAFGSGKTAAFASDVAPHWAGSLVDWGSQRISTQAQGGNEIEVGNHYANLFINIISWLEGN